MGLPSAGTITGTDSVCQGDTVQLSDLVTGGTWSTSIGNALADPSSGGIAGVTAGQDTVKYTVTGTCGTSTATFLINVRSHAACNVGVQNIVSSAAEFKVYPNPSNGSFTVEIPETTSGSTVTIMDVLGKAIETRVIAGTRPQKMVFNLFNTAPGSYMLKVNAGSRIYREKIVIW